MKQRIAVLEEEANELTKNTENLNNKLEEYKKRKSNLYGMVNNIDYSMEWLETGHEPNNWSGIPNLKAGEGELKSEDQN